MMQSKTVSIAIRKLVLLALIMAIYVVVGSRIIRELDDSLHQNLYFSISAYIAGLFIAIIVGYPNKFPFNSSGLSNRDIVIARFGIVISNMILYGIFVLIVTRDIHSLFWKVLWLLFGGAITSLWILFFFVSYPNSVLFNLNRLLYPEEDKESESSLDTDQ